MTTVAYDGKTLAADTAMVIDNKKVTMKSKIRKFDDGTLVGFAGIASVGIVLMNWLEYAHTDPVPPFAQDDEADVLVIRPDGRVSLYDQDGVEFELDDDKVAIGSGGDLAIGAMLAGATAIEAVKIAALRDINTGSKIISLVRGTKSKR